MQKFNGFCFPLKLPWVGFKRRFPWFIQKKSNCLMTSDCVIVWHFIQGPHRTDALLENWGLDAVGLQAWPALTATAELKCVGVV